MSATATAATEAKTAPKTTQRTKPSKAAHDHAGGGGAALPSHTGIAVIGSGFSGLAVAIQLRRSGRRDFVVLERGHDVGGTWRDNTYPGCRCDVPSHLYSLSFAPNPDWSESFSAQEEIYEYLRATVDRFGLARHIHTSCEVGEAAWDEGAGLWRLRTSRGELTADILVSAIGGLVEPNTPAIPGLDEFPGHVFHSARWDHDYELEGKRVAVVGTGASAIQFVPRIQPEVAEMTLFQRTPAWIAPRVNRPVSRLERGLFRRFPALQRLARTGIYWARELVARGMTGDDRVLNQLQRIATGHLHMQVKDPELRRKLTPDYRIGCKRILISNDFYPSLASDNVELVAAGVEEVRGSTVVGSDGSEAEVDAIIFGTGFHVSDTPAAKVIRGADGRTLRETWGETTFAHKGMSVAGFPNMFMVFGPHAGIGHTSATVMIEAQVGYLIRALDEIERRGAARVEVKREAMEAFLAEIDRLSEGTVWTSGGCKSWYLDATGRNSTLWPTYTFRYQRRMERFDPGEYEFSRGESGKRGAARAGAQAEPAAVG
jgi:cation diffusion facilitator CzcD-associated flavoprotein CzcO